VDCLVDKKAPEIIRHLRAHFSRYGVPEVLISDNGPPFNSAEFKSFATRYEFEHRTSSPRFPQSNGKAENAVKTIKNLMRKAGEAHRDPYLALLDWRNTPSESFGTSPAQRLLGRRVQTLLGISGKLLDVSRARNTKRCLRRMKKKQASYYNRTAQQKPELPLHQTIRAHINDQTGWVKAEVVEKLPYRSYRIETEDGSMYRRNRKHVRFSSEPPIIRADLEPLTNTENHEGQAHRTILQPSQPKLPQSELSNNTNVNQKSKMDKPELKTRSGRTVHAPKKLIDYMLS
jgi:hypothetical protein